MIVIQQLNGSKDDGTFLISLTHSKEVFREALTWYREHEDYRDGQILVKDADGKSLYACKYLENNVGAYGGLAKDMVHVSDFWEYDLSDERLDYELVCRGEVFVFAELEEYTYAVARIVREHFPEKKVFFLDKKASLFFGDKSGVHVLESLSEFYAGYREMITKSVYYITSERDFKFDSDMYIEKHYQSLHMMEGLFWRTKTKRLGNKNQDKHFCLITNPIGMQGLVDVVKFTLFRAMMLKKKNMDYIPVVALDEAGDNNQFNGGNGEDVWMTFFEQLSPYTAQEVRESADVLVLGDQQLMFNPYLLEEFYYEDWSIMFHDFLRFNPRVLEHIRKMKEEFLPDNPGKVLGVIGRGTDYNSSQTAGFLGKPLTGEELEKEVVSLVEKHGFDHVFLATEDQSVFDVFMKSELMDKIFFIPQERIDYSDLQFHDKYLVDIYREKKSDGYRNTMRYLGILDILAHDCTAMVATVDCGAYHFALALNGHSYEFAKAYATTKQS